MKRSHDTAQVRPMKRSRDWFIAELGAVGPQGATPEGVRRAAVAKAERAAARAAAKKKKDAEMVAAARAAKMETKTEVKSSGTICPGEEFTAPQVHRPKKIIPIAKVKPQDSLTRCCVRNRNIRIHPLFRIKGIPNVPKLKS